MNLQGIKTRNLEQYKKLHQKIRYGVSANRRAGHVVRYFEALGPKAILDYGCGRCDIVLNIDGAKGFLFDPAIPGLDEIPKEFFDTDYDKRALLSSHVLEHLDPVEIDDVLAHMKELAPNILIIVPTTKARQILPSGENAHSTVRDLGWWVDKIGEFFPFVKQVKGHRSEPTFVTWRLPKPKLDFVEKPLIFPTVRGKTVAIVGKAKSLIGSGEGARIDACDLVVRVNAEVPIDKSLAADIGGRTDALFLNRSRKSVELQAKKYNIPFTRYDKGFRNKLKDSEGYVPFTGTVAVFWFLSKGAKSVYATGMDFYSTGSIENRGGHLRTKIGTGTHDPTKDRDRLKELHESQPEKLLVGKALKESFEIKGTLRHFRGLKPDYSNYSRNQVPRRQNRPTERREGPNLAKVFVAPRRPHITWSRKANVSLRPEDSQKDESRGGFTGPTTETENENARQRIVG